jgi:hypothetical protein
LSVFATMIILSCRQQADPSKAQPIRRLPASSCGARFDTPCRASSLCRRYCRRTILSQSFRLACCAITIRVWSCSSLPSLFLVSMSSPYGIRASTGNRPIAGFVIAWWKFPKLLEERGRARFPGLQELAMPVGQNTQPLGQPARLKRFHFTEIRIYRIYRPSRSGKRGGRTSSRAADRAAVDAGGVGHGTWEQGGMNPVRSRRRADERRSMRTANTRGPGRRCYGQALAKAASNQPGRCLRVSRGDGGKKEFVSGESAEIKPFQPLRGEGRMSRLPCIAPVHLRVQRFRTGVLRVPAGTRPSLRPLVFGA